jgi:2-amino-4-hydroxy-6-hydroxymethyldihydropteridine diphosphokinase
MSTVYLGIGSNIDARANIRTGIEALRENFERVECSPVYRAPAVGFHGSDFLNLVARIETELTPLGLRDWLHALEDRHGRDRNQPKFSDRTLDIDILLYDDLYLLAPKLEIPRDEILTSAHVLKPLADLAPDLEHPVLRRTMAELWDEFPNQDSGLEPVDL